MAKVYFRYGAMNSGKSTALLQAAFNYEERGQRVVLLKPWIDTKGGDQILSRLGVARSVDALLRKDDSVVQVVEGFRQDGGDPIACVLVDEAQFLTPAQVDELMILAVQQGIPVLAYGIRTDFQTLSFPGSQRLLEIAHSLEELKTICRCGRKAMFNGRQIDGAYVFDGAQVAIDGVEVTYESLCPSCYLSAGGVLPYVGNTR